MPQFDVYANPSASTKRMYPYLLELQSDILSAQATQIVGLWRKIWPGRRRAEPHYAKEDLRQRRIVDSYSTNRITAYQLSKSAHRHSRANTRWNGRRTRPHDSWVLVWDIAI
ncbi:MULTISPECIES: CcdB family protein [unclassified Halomonas]|uniref:CcdB family protein n=1 Tax=unclassified Halomonas TaxID=2609666 RepID=UPI001C94B384|nr:CcdB family protein [Halomonas sp. DP4Y7-2]MBY6233233.1 CcdB family protein [Halomonas sp. DP4Y7-1]